MAGPDNLKRFRHALGLSQRALARLMARTDASICHYELGKRTPNRITADRFIALGEDFGVPISYEKIWEKGEPDDGKQNDKTPSG